jgi:hypothetical protein
LGTWGITWEHDGSTLGIWKETKKIPSLPLQKEKNWTPLEWMLSLLLIGCTKLLFPKLFVTIFGPG